METKILQYQCSSFAHSFAHTISAQPLLFQSNHYQIQPIFSNTNLLQNRIIEQAISAWEMAQPQPLSIDLQQAIEHFWLQQQITTLEEQANWIQSRQLTLEQLQKLALQNFKLTQFKQAQWNDQVNAYFLQRQPDLDQVVYSLIRVKDAVFANELYARIQSGVAFAELAQHSQGIESTTGGLIGPVPLHCPHPVVRKILANSKVGEVCSPQPLEGWFVIIRLERCIATSLDERMRQRLLNELFDRWLQAETKALNSISFHPTPSANDKSLSN